MDARRDFMQRLLLALTPLLAPNPTRPALAIGRRQHPRRPVDHDDVADLLAAISIQIDAELEGTAK
jgi:hypothetical protein